MPLYTYIATYRGRSYVKQGRYSNYRGWTPYMITEMPESFVPKSDKALLQELVGKLQRSEWSAVDFCSNVWRTSVEVRGDRFEYIAVLSKS